AQLTARQQDRPDEELAPRLLAQQGQVHSPGKDLLQPGRQGEGGQATEQLLRLSRDTQDLLRLLQRKVRVSHGEQPCSMRLPRAAGDDQPYFLTAFSIAPPALTRSSGTMTGCSSMAALKDRSHGSQRAGICEASGRSRKRYPVRWPLSSVK